MVGLSRYREGMASPAVPADHGTPGPPDADPEAIRACLPVALRRSFDREWVRVLEDAKTSHRLVEVHALLQSWRAIAAGELRDPGSHERMVAKAESIRRTGQHPGAVPLAELTAAIRGRLAR